MQNLGVIVEKETPEMFISVQKSTKRVTIARILPAYIGSNFIFWICEDFANYSRQPVSI